MTVYKLCVYSTILTLSISDGDLQCMSTKITVKLPKKDTAWGQYPLLGGSQCMETGIFWRP